MSDQQITFSVRPLSLREMALVQRVAQQDAAAIIELIVLRSDPPVSAAVVGELAGSEILATTTEMARCIAASAKVDALLTDAVKDIPPPADPPGGQR